MNSPAVKASSQTAAAARAAHLIVDAPPYIFADTLAQRLLGNLADELIDYHRNHGAHLVLVGARTQVACRSRFAEARVAAGVARGVDQYVILGAGLDTFGYRSELARQLRVFEVDHPATQDWKRGSLATAEIPVPDSVHFVPMDFESDSLPQRLAEAGYDRTRPAVVSWLGVTMYLTRPAIAETLAVLGGFAPGTELVMDYMLPAELRDETGQTYVDLVAPMSAERGEPWLTFLTPADLSTMLTDAGFGEVTHADQADAIESQLWNRTDPLRPAELSMLVSARRS
jgi:methyltransferase (TIGR00027 family)